MNWGIFFGLLTVHLFCDFVIQPNRLVNLRYSNSLKKRVKGNGYHAGIHFVTSLTFVFLVYSFSAVSFFVLITAAFFHGLVDFLKSWIINSKPHRKNNLLLFLGDQWLHTALLFVFSAVIGFYAPVRPLIGFVQKPFTVLVAGFLTPITYNQKLVLTTAILLAALWGVGIFIRIFLAGLKSKTEGDKDVESHMKSMVLKHATPDGGFIIGIMERFFIICSIVLNMTQIIGFLLATKSIARFKKFDDDCFVENFIIGSFISFTAAIVAGVVIKALHIITY